MRICLSEGDQAIVFSLSQGPVSPLTGDAATLIAAMKGLRLHPRLERPDPLKGYLTPYDAYLRRDAVGPQASAARALWREVESNNQGMIEALDDIVNFAGRLPGRRMVVLASPGFIAQTKQQEQERLIDRAVRNRVVLNTLSVTGVWAGPLPIGPAASRLHAIGPQAQTASEAILANLADSTGGEFVHNQNDLLAGFQRVAGLPDVSYLIGFTPALDKHERYHHVRVHLVNRKGEAAKFRPGYFSQPPDSADSPEREIDRAIADGATRNGISVSMSSAAQSVNGAPAVMAVAHIDVAKLALARGRAQRAEGDDRRGVIRCEW